MGEIIVTIPNIRREAIMGPPPEPNRSEHPYSGTINFQGILVYVENVPGSIREGVDAGGQPWRTQMQHYYGEMPGTSGADGDPVDVYVGDNPFAPIAYILHSRNFFGTEHATEATYDEDKVMLGFGTLSEALSAYAAHYNGPQWRPGVTAMPVAELRQRLRDGELEWGAAVVKGGKYLRRWRGPDGEWRYEYPKDRKGRARGRSEPEPRGASRPRQAPPGSQLPAEALAQLKDLGVKKLPAADIPLSDIQIKLTPRRGIHKRAVLSWRDGRGEKQNAYSQRFHEASAREKWERVVAFRDEAPRYVRRAQRQLKTEDHGTLRHQGLTVALIVAQTGLRPGSESSLKKTGHRGISTLTAGNVKIRGDVVSFEYTGKAGKLNTGSVRSRALAQALRKYKRGKKKGDRLFGTTALAAARATLPEGMLLKDFRTIRATNEAIKALDAVVRPPPLTGNAAKDRRLLRKALRTASSQVADVLNNTPAVAMASYIHPVIFDQWVRDKVGADPAIWK